MRRHHRTRWTTISSEDHLVKASDENRRVEAKDILKAVKSNYEKRAEKLNDKDKSE